MKLLTVLLALLDILVLLLIAAGNLVALLTEVLVNEDDATGNPIGNHLTTGSNDIGDNADGVKRAGNHYLSDRDTPPYDQPHRH